MRVVVIMIPMFRNDGTEVSQAELAEIQQSLWVWFGGLTIEGIVTGHWIDDSDGRHYEDKNLKVSIALDPTRMDEAREVVREIGRRLGQEAMYFEVGASEVEFLRT